MKQIHYSCKNQARPTLRLLSSVALTRKFMNDKPQTLQHRNSVKIARGDGGNFRHFSYTLRDTYTSGRLKKTSLSNFFFNRVASRARGFEKMFMPRGNYLT